MGKKSIKILCSTQLKGWKPQDLWTYCTDAMAVTKVFSPENTELPVAL